MKEKKKQQKTPKKAETNKRADENNSSYAAVVKEAPQLMSPMVFAGQDQSPRTPLIQNLATPPVNLATPPVNGNSASMPQLTPLTEPQLLQVNSCFFLILYQFLSHFDPILIRNLAYFQSYFKMHFFPAFNNHYNFRHFNICFAQTKVL